MPLISMSSTRQSISSGIRRARGVTLIELVIALTVAAILAAIAAPSFRTFMANQRIRSATSDLVLQLTFTRSEAIKQNANITMASDGGTTAWQGGWSVTDSDGTIKKQGAYTGVKITSSATDVVYNRSGRSNDSGITFEVADAASGTTVTPRCVTVGLTGQPVSKAGGC